MHVCICVILYVSSYFILKCSTVDFSWSSFSQFMFPLILVLLKLISDWINFTTNGTFSINFWLLWPWSRLQFLLQPCVTVDLSWVVLLVSFTCKNISALHTAFICIMLEMLIRISTLKGGGHGKIYSEFIV